MMWHRCFKDRMQFIGDWLFDTQALKQMGGFYNLPYAWNANDITAYLCAKDSGVANTQEPCFRYRVNNFSITRDRTILSGKIRAYRMAHSWYTSFLENKPSARLDVMYWQDLMAGIDSYFSRTISLEISGSYCDRLTRLFLDSKKIVSQNGVTWRELLKAFYFIIKWRVKSLL